MLNIGIVDKENLCTNIVSYSRFTKCPTIITIDSICDVDKGAEVGYNSLRQKRGTPR